MVPPLPSFVLHRPLAHLLYLVPYCAALPPCPLIVSCNCRSLLVPMPTVTLSLLLTMPAVDLWLHCLLHTGTSTVSHVCSYPLVLEELRRLLATPPYRRLAAELAPVVHPLKSAVFDSIHF